nr:hypothetical protein [Allomuricauda sp.]
MKKLLITLFILPIWMFAQEDGDGDKKDEISVDLLRSPSSPAFTVLGLQTTDIERPTNPTDLAVSLRTSSENFTAFPNSYSLEFAPGWVFGGNNITYDDFDSDDIVDNLIQNTVLSFAINTKEENDSISTTQVALGVKFSLLRGCIDSEYGLKRDNRIKLDNSLNKILDFLAKSNEEAEEEAKNDEAYLRLEGQIASLVDSIRQETDDTEKEILKIELRALQQQKSNFVAKYISEKLAESETMEQERKELQELAEQVKFEREGFKLDLSLAASWNFEQQNINNGKLFNYGGWLTGAYDLNPDSKKTNLSILGTARMLLSPDEEYTVNATMMTDDLLRFDVGGRVILGALERKLSISAEGLYRTVLNNDNIDDTHRLVFNLEYEVSKNRLLTLSLGRDFDGNFNSDGNLIAFLNLVVGIGSKRPF